jgi:hypothetical protein
MFASRVETGEHLLLRMGAVAAIIGTLLQVAAGTSQSSLLGATSAAALENLAALPEWSWPVIYLGFIFGALLWVGALVALASTLTEGAAWALGRLAVPAAIVGATLHTVDGSLNAVALTGLAHSWSAAVEGDRAALAQNTDLLLRVLDGTWAGVITLFHGVPFALAGLAVVMSRRYPAWLGWVGFIGGAGSVVVGVTMMLGRLSAGLAVPFAVILSLFMVVLGWHMWVQTDRPVATFATERTAARPV